jgi:hypothetical protein
MDRRVRRQIGGSGFEYLLKEIIMSGSLHPNEIHRRQHRKQKRDKLRAQLAATPAVGRAAIEAKLQKTYAVGYGPPPTKPSADEVVAARAVRAGR